MDFVTGWKASSIVLTGAFGVLGLAKEYKDKDTKKITVWGKISLAGILLSAGLGVAAQLKESSQQEIAKAATAAQTLALAQNTDKAVHDLRRVLSPLEDPLYKFVFDVPCSEVRYRLFCKDARLISLDEFMKLKYVDRHKHWSHWPGGPDSIMEFNMRLFVDAKDADLYVEDMKRDGVSLKQGNLELLVLSSNFDDKKTLSAFGDAEKVQVYVRDFSPGPRGPFHEDEKIKSVIDIEGATAIMGGEFIDLTPTDVEVTSKRGQTLSAWGPFQKIPTQHEILYRFTFPKWTK